jgi:hypothetical protein
MLLLVSTDQGTLARTIPNASPLRQDLNQGDAAEHAAHGAAAIWGLPDFVFRAPMHQVGSGVRELGDGLIIVGELGIVVQVKSREAPSGDVDKESRWLNKKIGTALRQGRGTARLLAGQRPVLINARGREIELDASSRRWMTVVVIDHPDVPEGVRPPTLPDHPSAVILRRDWEFVFSQLKATHAVAEYFERIADDPVDLGLEPVRYYELATADEMAPAAPLPEVLQGRGVAASTPVLPLQPTATDDEQAHRLIRSVFEDIATTSAVGTTEANRLRVLAELDRLTVGQRAGIGRYLIEGLAAVAKAGPGETLWQLRTVVGERGVGILHLGFGAGSQHSEAHQWAFSAWVQLRHDQLYKKLDRPAGLTTVGVLLTPRHDGRRPWDTTLSAVAGDLHLDEEQLAEYEELWPTRRSVE